MKKRLASIVFIACLTCNLLACSNSTDKSEIVEDGIKSEGSDNQEDVLDNESINDDSDTVNLEKPEKAMTEYQKLFQYGPLLVSDENNKWGYINESGEYAIEPIFSKANSFGDNGLAIVQDAETELWGVIDRSGNYVIEPKYLHLGSDFRDGLLLAREPELHAGYIDETGEYVIEPQFTRAYEFCNGFARVSSQIAPYDSDRNYMMGYIDTSGKRITEDIFPEAEDFYGDRALVMVDEGADWLYGYIDKTGNIAIEPLYPSAGNFYSHNTAIVHEGMSVADQTTSLIDKDGNVLFSGTNYEFGNFDSGLCPVSTTYNEPDYTEPNAGWDPLKVHFDNTDYVYINSDGEIVLPKDGTSYEDATDFHEGYAAVMDAESHLWGYIDTKGNWVASPQYVSAYPYQEGIAVVAAKLNEIQKDVAYAYDDIQLIDTSGKCIMKFNNGVAPVIHVTGNTTAILSTERIAVTPIDIDENGLISGMQKMGLCDYNNNLVVDCIFDRIDSIARDSSYVTVCYNGLLGMIDKDGNWLIQPKFTRIK